jgi:hypothetical protein
MANPLRSEGEAFRFLILSALYLGGIALASGFGGVWWGLGVFVILSAVALYAWWRSRTPAPPLPPVQPVHRGGPQDRRILVVANETVGGEKLRSCIRERAEGFNTRVLVVSPALNSPLRHLVSDEDPARAAAQARLEASLARLGAAGIAAEGHVGDGDPLQALEDAIRTFGPDEIIVSTHPEGRSHWLEQGIVEAARRRFAVPITHVVVDLAAEHEEVRSPD